jgi:hypothetical protein
MCTSLSKEKEKEKINKFGDFYSAYFSLTGRSKALRESVIRVAQSVTHNGRTNTVTPRNGKL